MSHKKTAFFLFFCLCVLHVSAQLTDTRASQQTRNLYKNLMRLSGKEILFGHQDDMAYGVNWKYQEGRSDVKDLTGAYPAVFGWDVAGLETGKKVNIDGVSFQKMRAYIKHAYDMGAVNTISWHMDNPANGKTAWDTSSAAVPSILPEGEKHFLYRNWLDQFALFAKSLKGSDGKAIPILFRPFHENGGSWFWWGTKTCTPQQYKALWQFTVTYLRDKKQVHNLIYVFNPCDFKTEAEYLERYPGDRFADVLSFDYYQYGGITKGETFIQDVSRGLAIQQQIATKAKKLSALAETGFVEIPDADWWTTVFAKAMEQHKPAYVLLWRNAGYREQEKDNHYYTAYPGQASAADFLKLVKEHQVILQKGLKKYAIYQ